MKKLKIAVLYSDLSRDSGGAFSYVNTCIDSLSKSDLKQKYDIYFMTYSEISHSDSKLKTVKNRLLPSFDVKKDSLNSLNFDFAWSLEPLHRPLSVPYVNTIWDLNHRNTPWFPEFGEGEWEAREKRFVNSIGKATFTVTGTEQTARDLDIYYSPRIGSIKVLPMPVNDLFFEINRTNSTNDHFFYPAPYWHHKNHKLIVDAFSLLKNQGLLGDLKIDFLGADKGLKSQLIKFIKQRGLENNINIEGFSSFPSLISKYKEYGAMIYPSHFGPDNLPPLEALASNCPVMLAELNGSREFYGDRVMYFDNNSAESLASCIQNFRSGIRPKIYPSDSQFLRSHTEENFARIFDELISEIHPSLFSWKIGSSENE